MSVFLRPVQYYETDMMGITHHANYIHMMEEARIAFMDAMGYSYQRLESEGVVSPVTSISCKYISPTTFGDTLSIETTIAAFNGVVLTMAYVMAKQDGTKVFTGTSEHAFLHRDGRFVRLKREYPEFYQVLTAQMTAVERPDPA